METYAKYLYYENSHIKCVCNNIISLRWCVKITRMIYEQSILNCFCCSTGKNKKKSLKFKFKTLFSNVKHIKYSGINCFQEATKNVCNLFVQFYQKKFLLFYFGFFVSFASGNWMNFHVILYTCGIWSCI